MEGNAHTCASHTHMHHTHTCILHSYASHKHTDSYASHTHKYASHTFSHTHLLSYIRLTNPLNKLIKEREN